MLDYGSVLADWSVAPVLLDWSVAPVLADWSVCWLTARACAARLARVLGDCLAFDQSATGPIDAW